MSAFLDHMPDSVAPQRELLRRLLAVLEADPSWRWLELSCSLARDAGDELSDIDCGAGVRDEEYAATLSTVESMVAGLGEVVDMLHHELQGVSQKDWVHRHTFVQYADGVQLSLVVVPASGRQGLPPGAVALMDKDGQLGKPLVPASYQASAKQCREWTFFGWQALSDLDKYLRRGSLWKAHQRLEEARGQVWRLWAVTQDVQYPGFGLTSVLDGDAPMPAGIAETVAGLDAVDLRRAALMAAELLTQLGPPLEIGRFVARRLAG